MGVYALTGSASGMGAASAAKLSAAGHQVIGVDIQQADIVADLSTSAGRSQAVADILVASEGRLDGVVAAAGVGPLPDLTKMPAIAEINYLGVVELLSGLRPALAKAEKAKVVVYSSNSTTTTPGVPRRAIRALLDGDVDKAVRAVKIFGKMAPSMYAASKVAVSHWVRRTAVTPEWAGAGIRLNALAPGAVMTPLLAKQLSTPDEAKNIESFPVPIGGYGDTDQLGEWTAFMLSDAADFLCGSVVFVDGGSDAWYRADEWPLPPRLWALPAYLKRSKAFHASR